MDSNHAAQVAANKGLYVAPLVMGCAMDSVLLGVMVHQFILWHSSSRGERAIERIFVLTSVCIGTAASLYIIWYMYNQFVTEFEVYANFLPIVKEYRFVLFNVLTTVAVQLFFVERAYGLLGRKIWVPTLVSPFLVASIVGGLLVVVNKANDAFDVDRVDKYMWLWLSTTLATDLLISGLMMYALFKQRTGWKKADALVFHLIRTSAETQLPATVSAIVFLVTFGVDQRTPLLVMWEMAFPKLHVVSLLAVLNYRFALRMKTGSHNGLNSDDRKPENTFEMSRRPHQDTILDIHVQTDRYEESHDVVLPRVGVNRMRHPDEESTDYQGEGYGYESSSQVGLTRNASNSKDSMK